MEIKQAIQVLWGALEAANKSGTYSLNDSVVITQAFKVVENELTAVSTFNGGNETITPPEPDTAGITEDKEKE